MRLWTIHPYHLDSKGIVALWREALLAKAVLNGSTKGYKAHPQLDRFREQESPILAIDAYLRVVYQESLKRGYSFDSTKFTLGVKHSSIIVTTGQIEYEWEHLLGKLRQRSQLRYDDALRCSEPNVHPLFAIVPGVVEPWERV